jgi:hypothetical protein
MRRSPDVLERGGEISSPEEKKVSPIDRPAHPSPFPSLEKVKRAMAKVPFLDEWRKIP